MGFHPRGVTCDLAPGWLLQEANAYSQNDYKMNVRVNYMNYRGKKGKSRGVEEGKPTGRTKGE